MNSYMRMSVRMRTSTHNLIFFICNCMIEYAYNLHLVGTWQNRVVPLDLFSPREVSAQDQEAGLCTTSQFPTQAARMISRDNSSQFPSLLEDMRNTPTGIFGSRNDSLREEAKQSSFFNKKARTLENVGQKGLLSSEINLSIPIRNMNATEDNMVKDTADMSHVVPDVAAAIEDLLEQTSKVKILVLL